jgi:hypothetical protein
MENNSKTSFKDLYKFGVTPLKDEIDECKEHSFEHISQFHVQCYFCDEIFHVTEI